MFIIRNNIKLAEKIQDEKQISIRNYTSHLKSANFLKTKIYENLNDLIKHLNKVFDIEAKKQGFKEPRKIRDNKNLKKFGFDESTKKLNLILLEKGIIYDINYPFINPKLLENVNYLNRKKVERNFISRKIIEENNNKNLEEKKLEEKSIKNFEEKLEKISNEIKKTEKLLDTIDDKREMQILNDIFITFRNQKIAYLINSAYDKGKCTRFFYILCCQYNKIKHLYYKNKWLNIAECLDEPSNINWNNITYSKFLRFLRKIFSFLIAVLIILCSFGAAIISKYIMDSITENYNPNIDCSYISKNQYNNSTIIFKEFTDNSIKSSTKYLTYCHCLEIFVSKGPLFISKYSIEFSNTNIKPCVEWFNNFIKYNSINLAVIIVIPLINSILVIILRLFAKFEKNKTLTQEVSSIMWKIFSMQFINSGIVLFAVNFRIEAVKKWNKNFPVFTGTHSDLDPNWYSSIGVTIVNIFIFS